MEEKDYKSEASEILSKAIQMVVFKYNAYSPIISSLQVVYSDMVPTLGVDKYARMVVNPKFLVENKAYAIGMLIHETLHIFMGHTGETREKLKYTEDEEHNKWVNIAEDCAINQFISEPLPTGAVTVRILSDMLGVQLNIRESSEYYYDNIMRYKKEEMNYAGIDGNNNRENSDGDNSNNGNGNGNSSINNPCCTDVVNSQNIQDELEKMGVKHISQEEITEKVMATAKAISKAQGNQYGELTEFARKMLEPKIDWRPLLQSTIRNAEKKIWSSRTKSTYKRVSKRSRDVLLPKKYGNKIEVAISFDTSGSISADMVNQFLSEISGCLKFSNVVECALWHTDNYWYGTPEELNKNVEKIFESGGTDEGCMGIAESHCKADLYFHFSDGYHGNSFGFKHPEKNIEIIWDGEDIKEIRKGNELTQQGE